MPSLENIKESSDLRRFFQSKLNFIRAMKYKKQIPSDEQLRQFLSGVENYAKKIALERTDDEIESLFDKMKIDHSMETLPTIDELEDKLQQIVYYFRKKENIAAVQFVNGLSDSDINSFDKVVSMLWDVDANRLDPNYEYKLNVQTEIKVYHNQDGAEFPLFRFVDQGAMVMPTYKTFFALLDNYQRDPDSPERDSDQEKQENWEFINRTMETAPMLLVKRFLMKSGKLPARCQSDKDFGWYLYKAWFYMYRRGNDEPNSSGFEHVFVGESKKENGRIIVSGMHNWIQILIEERRKNLNYYGCIASKYADVDQLANEQILPLKFSWHDEMKNVGTSFIGVSPEFELALYTLCFAAGHEDNDVKLGKYRVSIRCHSIGKDDGAKVGTAFPEIEH